MRQSTLFTKTRKEAPKDETAKNAELLIRAGFINKEMAGVYSLLPLGLKVVEKIKKIVAEEMEALGSEEILMSTLQNKETWEKTGRWDDEAVDVWFKSELKTGTEVGFGWSHEEPITEMMKYHISSYSDLPRAVHQFQNKLRNEVRAKSGIMRCREFIMKDMYFFADSEEKNKEFYDRATVAYTKVFERLGLGEITYITSASGGLFTDKFSHEFQTICDAGEDIVYINKEKKVALNEEIFNSETLEKMGMQESDFEKVKTAEVGNIFNFGSKKSEQMDLYFKDSSGDRAPAFLSSYGIGITRLLGVLVEVFAKESNMYWPKEVAPFRMHLISLGNNEKTLEYANSLYEKLKEKRVEVLYDDRDMRPGEKFADADLIGIIDQFVVSDRSIEAGGIEYKERITGETKIISEEEFLNA